MTIGIHERDAFYLATLRDADNLAAIREIAQELFGPDFQVVIESLPDAEPAAAPAPGVAATGSDDSTLEDMQQSKLAFKQAVVDIFQAVPR